MFQWYFILHIDKVKYLGVVGEIIFTDIIKNRRFPNQIQQLFLSKKFRA